MAWEVGRKTERLSQVKRTLAALDSSVAGSTSQLLYLPRHHQRQFLLVPRVASHRTRFEALIIVLHALPILIQAHRHPRCSAGRNRANTAGNVEVVHDMEAIRRGSARDLLGRLGHRRGLWPCARTTSDKG